MKYKARVKFSDTDCEAVADYFKLRHGEPVNRAVVERYIQAEMESMGRDWVARIRQLSSRIRHERTK